MARTLKTTEDAQALRIRELERVLREWNDVFASPSRALQAAGVASSISSSSSSPSSPSNSPLAVSRRVLELHEALLRSESGAAGARVALEKEISDLRAALRDASRVAREQAAHEVGRIKREADAVIAAERASREAMGRELDALRRSMDDDVRTSVMAEVAAQTSALRAELARVRAAAERDVSEAAARQGRAEADAAEARDLLEAARADRADAEAAHAAERASLRQQVGALKDGLVSAERAHRAELGEAEAAWRARLVEAHERWERSTSAARVAHLEDQVRFLSERVRSLQELWDVSQGAMMGGGGGGGGGAGGGVFVAAAAAAAAAGAPAAPSSGPAFRGPPQAVQTARGARPVRGVATVRHAGVDAAVVRAGALGGVFPASVPTETRFVAVR
jgi:hypothetical protein